MVSFDFVSPTKVYFGKDKEKSVGSIIKKLGYQRIAFVYGKSSIKTSGLYDVVVSSLKDEGIDFIEVAGVEANPKLSLINKYLPVLREYKIDFILAVGGGSVLDTAKSIAHSYNYDGDPFDFNAKKAVANESQVLKVGCILTISAAGSELSNSCVISNDLVTPYKKQGFNSDTNRPIFAICNPYLTVSVSKYQTACGVVDIMMHTLERYFNVNDTCMLSDSFALGLLKTVYHYGKIAYDDPSNIDARSELMLASSYSHNGLTGLGKSQFLRVHGLEHTLSGMYDNVAHGAGLAILFPSWCTYIKDDKKAELKLKELFKTLFDDEDINKGIQTLKDYFKSLGMPVSLKEIGVSDIEGLALNYSNNKKISFKDYKELNYESAYEIYRLSL